MKIKHWIRYCLFHDTTWHGQFSAASRILKGKRSYAKYVVDVGANDGFYSSNSYPFIKRGWNAVLCEPDPDAFAKVSKLHAGNRRVTLLKLACGDELGEKNLIRYLGDSDGSHSSLDQEARHPSQLAVRETIPVKVEPLETILVRHAVPEHFGLLSIDTEGYDYFVIRGLNLGRFRPCVIISEKDGQDVQKHEYLTTHGYHLHQNLEFDTVWTTDR